MKRFWLILKYIGQIDALVARVAVLEEELALRVSRLEAQVVANEKRDDEALAYLSCRASEKERVRKIETALSISIARPWPT